MTTTEVRRTWNEQAISTVREDLRHNGFAIVENIIPRASLARFRDVLIDIEATGSPSVDDPYIRRLFTEHNGVSHLDQAEVLYPSYRRPELMDNEMYSICGLLADAIEPGYSLSFDTAFIKMPRSRSFILWHRDSDHSPLRRLGPAFLQRLHFWVPLQDTNEENGCLQYISGSHREPRLLTVHDRRRVACVIPAGSIAIHTAQTLHGSGSNSTDEPRASCTLTFGRFGLHKGRFRKAMGRVPAQQ